MALKHTAGNPALDLINTVIERDTAHRDRLMGPDVLARWYVEAGIVSHAPEVDGLRLEEACHLREHLYLLVRSLVDETPSPERSRTLLNEVARLPGPFPELGPDGRVIRRADAAACLAAVARAAMELFDPDGGAIIRFCTEDLCTNCFLDRSRSQMRRWCDPDSCGSREKVRRYRQGLALRQTHQTRD